MNQADYARHQGVSRKTITVWKNRGILVFNGKEIDVEKSDENVTQYLKKTKQGNKLKGNNEGNNIDDDLIEKLTESSGVNLTFDEARRMKENYLALLSKVEYETKIGRLLPFSEMLDAVKNEYSRMRTRLISIAPEQGPRLKIMATTCTDQEFVEKLQDIISEVMKELSLDERSERNSN
ncbi:hypothetical protein RHO12_12735 (plasmid) [Orbus sturtevantii]|uniref:RNA polymerase subunit sigma-70 n=1 Tax=Orbus sturtevantii TaxID=3074109 RepID=UPI00370DB1B8